MNPQELYPIIEPVDAILIPFLADPEKEDNKKSDAQKHRDRINSLVSDFSEEMKKRTEDIKNDYKSRIQREVDEINRIVAS